MPALQRSNAVPNQLGSWCRLTTVLHFLPCSKLVSLAERLAGLHAALQRSAGRSGVRTSPQPFSCSCEPRGPASWF